MRSSAPQPHKFFHSATAISLSKENAALFYRYLLHRMQQSTKDEKTTTDIKYSTGVTKKESKDTLNIWDDYKANRHKGTIDKDDKITRKFTVDNGVRIVPGGRSVRTGAYLAPSVIMMPPAYVNIGAYVDEGTMIDSHALVGSCAQVGKHVHLSAASQLGGVLEPVGALPVIIEDNVFIGGNCGIYEGTIVKENAVIGTGVIINASTAIFDATTGEYIRANEKGQIVVPSGAVVVAGSRPVSKGPGADQGIHLYCPVIVKYRDEKTSGSITLEDMLR